MPSTLILGCKSRTIGLRKLLEINGCSVIVIENPEGMAMMAIPEESCRFAVITDSFSEIVDADMVARIRQQLNPEKTICLSMAEDHETEKSLRSAGLTFFGSYQSFFAQADSILSNDGAKPVRNATFAPSRQTDAHNIETRLLSSPRHLQSLIKKQAFSIGLATEELAARTIEIAVAILAILLIVLPVSAFLLLRKWASGTPVFDTLEIRKTDGSCLQAKKFHQVSPLLASLPLFMPLITGEIALVGTALGDCRDDGPPAPEKGYINRIKPGIVSLWEIRRSSKIAHEGQNAIEWEYVFNKNISYDFMLFLRALPAFLYHETATCRSSLFSIFGLKLRNLTMEEAVGTIAGGLDRKEQSALFFVNPDCLNKMVDDREYFNILANAEHVFPDGIGLVIAGKLLGTPLKENINGTDMLPYLCRMAAVRGSSLFLLGGKPGVAEKAASRLRESYGAAIAGTLDGYFDHEHGSSQVIEAINRSGADILLVAFGAPMQEKWISRHREQLKPNILMGVGGLFDFYSGNIRRAPVWVREIGFEWIYRILQEPGRMWKRYVVGNPLFLYRVVKWKISPKGA